MADLIKDALVLPQAFIAAMQGEEEQEFRQRCISGFQRTEALDVMIDGIKKRQRYVARFRDEYFTDIPMP